MLTPEFLAKMWDGAYPLDGTPMCFASKADFERWADGPLSRGENFCTDCTKEYQDKMRTQGKCAFPHVKFEKDPETGLPMGVRHA